jgi:hypothetical protein
MKNQLVCTEEAWTSVPLQPQAIGKLPHSGRRATPHISTKWQIGAIAGG